MILGESKAPNVETGIGVSALKQFSGTLRSQLTGHFNYYGVIGNSQMLSEFFNAARHTTYRVLTSQKKSYSWKGFSEMWKTLDIPNPKIIETMQPTTPCLI